MRMGMLKKKMQRKLLAVLLTRAKPGTLLVIDNKTIDNALYTLILTSDALACSGWDISSIDPSIKELEQR